MLKMISQNLKEREAILALLIISTSLFVLQHAITLPWDFNAYVLNARFWFAEGSYFEPFRPPLMPFLIGVLSIFGWNAAEFLFIILASALFAYSSVRLARALKLNPAAFYALSLNSYVLAFGLLHGTEILSLIFLELFISSILEGSAVSGVFAGLCALSRYTGLALFPLMIFHLDFKKALKSFLLFLLVLSPWLAYNRLKFGNMFTSIADQYALNILNREYFTQNFKIEHFLTAFNILIPLILLGIFAVLSRLSKEPKKSVRKFLRMFRAEIIMFVILAYGIASYAGTPQKDIRYLFNMTLPVAYFSYLGLELILSNMRKILILSVVIFAVSALLFISYLAGNGRETPEVYNSAIKKLGELNLSNCSVMSNGWVPLNYLGAFSKPLPPYALLGKRIEEGEIIIFFKRPDWFEYAYNESFFLSFPVLYDSPHYIILGSGTCLKPQKFEETYLQQLDKKTFELYGYRQNQNPCFVLFHNLPILEKSCNLINLRGFRQDEYRSYG